MTSNGWEFYSRVWRPAQLVVSDFERVGVRFDPQACAEGAFVAGVEVANLEQDLNQWAGAPINWRSVPQKKQLLYGTTIAPATKGGPDIVPKGFDVPPIAGTLRAVKITQDHESPTSEAAVTYLRDHCEDADDRQGLDLLLDYMKVSRLLSFYESLPRFVGPDGRIHCQLGATTETGRLACKNPNMQNQPPEVRTCFVADPGHVILALDYSGLEWRILAHCLAHRGDQSLVEEIVAGIDPHSATAVRMGLCPGPVELVADNHKKARADAKVLNYSINYGKTPAGLGVQIRDANGNSIGKRAGQQMLDAFYKARPGIARFHRDIVAYAEAHGMVRSLLGRPRPIPEVQSDDRRTYERGTRLAKNVIQNCAADIVTLAMLRCHPVLHEELTSAGWGCPEASELGVRQLLQNHDELVFEVPEQHADRAKALLSERMVNALQGVRPFLCPLGVSGGVGPSWAAAK